MARSVAEDENKVTHWDWARAMSMWEEGINTYDIAHFFGVHESIIYNGLNKRREVERIATHE